MWSQSEEFKGLLEKVSNKGTMDELVDMAVKDAPYVSPVSPQNSVPPRLSYQHSPSCISYSG